MAYGVVQIAASNFGSGSGIKYARFRQSFIEFGVGKLICGSDLHFAPLRVDRALLLAIWNTVLYQYCNKFFC